MFNLFAEIQISRRPFEFESRALRDTMEQITRCWYELSSPTEKTLRDLHAEIDRVSYQYSMQGWNHALSAMPGDVDEGGEEINE